MKLTSLISRAEDTLEGLTAIARSDYNTQNLLRKIRPGEIAIIDEIDLDRVLAEQLVAKRVAAVVNASSFISGRFPNLGSEVLALAGIMLVENVGESALQKIKDGSKITIYEGEISHGGKILFSGHEVKEQEIAERIISARSAVTDHLEAFASNAIEFIKSEAPLLIDGIGIPEIDIDVRNRPVVIVSDNDDAKEDLKNIAAFIKEYRPIMIGVNRGADNIIRAGHRLDIVVGDPDIINSETLRAAKSVILPATPDGRVNGLYRIQDLGIGAMTFPARGQAGDLALILANHHGADFIVTVGHRASFEDFFDNKYVATNPSTFLTCLKMGEKLIDAKAIALLYKNHISTWTVLFFIVAAVLAIMAVLTVTGLLEPQRLWLETHMNPLWEKIINHLS